MFQAMVGLILSFSISANAYVGSVSAATGEAGRAAVEASETPYGNPASLAFLSGYYFAAGFGAAKKSVGGTAQDLAVSLTDNMRDTVLATSLSYVQNTNRPDSQSEEALSRQFKLSFGNFLRPGFAFGLAVNHKDDRLLESRFAQTNLQSGFLWAPNRDFGAALVMDNLLPPAQNVPLAYRLKKTTAFGASYNYKRFVRLKGDLISEDNNSFGKPTLAFGMESYMNRWLILRWGLQRNNLEEANLYTGGLGFVGPRFGLHYAYLSSPQNESLSRHSVDLAVPIW
jgi:hypothetical protein